jgi:hypothetical protein
MLICKLSHHPLVRSAIPKCTGIIFQCALHSVSPIESSLQFVKYILNSSAFAVGPSTGKPPIFKTPILNTFSLTIPIFSPHSSSVESSTCFPTLLLVSSEPVAASELILSDGRRSCHLRLLTRYPTKPAWAVGRGMGRLHFRSNRTSLRDPEVDPS